MANRFSVDDPRLVDDADNETRDVILTVRIETGHFRSFAANQRATGVAASFRETGNDRQKNVSIELTGGNVVEKKQRTSPLNENVINTMVHEVDADGIVPVHHDGDLELRTYAIGARNQHRLLHVAERA